MSLLTPSHESADVCGRGLSSLRDGDCFIQNLINNILSNGIKSIMVAIPKQNYANLIDCNDTL